MAYLDHRITKSVDMIYELTEYPLVTPATLLENLSYKHYSSILFKKKEENLIVELKCQILGKEMIYLYVFDKEQKLQTILSKSEEDEPCMLFSRSEELDKAKNFFIQASKELAC